MSPEKKTPQPPWATFSSAPSPSEGRSSSSCSDGTSSASVCACCPLSCRWAPLQRVWPHPPDTHPSDVCEHKLGPLFWRRDVTIIFIIWFAEILCGHFSPAQAPWVCQSFSCIFSLQWDSSGSQCYSSIWGAETFHKAEWYKSGWKSESLLSKHCCKQVTLGLKYWKAVI